MSGVVLGPTQALSEGSQSAWKGGLSWAVQAYDQRDWSVFWGQVLWKRAHWEEFSEEAKKQLVPLWALEVLSLAQHCQWESMEAVATWVNSQGVFLDPDREVRKALFLGRTFFRDLRGFQSLSPSSQDPINGSPWAWKVPWEGLKWLSSSSSFRVKEEGMNRCLTLSQGRGTKSLSKTQLLGGGGSPEKFE